MKVKTPSKKKNLFFFEARKRTRTKREIVWFEAAAAVPKN